MRNRIASYYNGCSFNELLVQKSQKSNHIKSQHSGSTFLTGWPFKLLDTSTYEESLRVPGSFHPSTFRHRLADFLGQWTMDNGQTSKRKLLAYILPNVHTCPWYSISETLLCFNFFLNPGSWHEMEQRMGVPLCGLSLGGTVRLTQMSQSIIIWL